jgi:hypothetical protein
VAELKRVAIDSGKSLQLLRCHLRWDNVNQELPICRHFRKSEHQVDRAFRTIDNITSTKSRPTTLRNKEIAPAHSVDKVKQLRDKAKLSAATPSKRAISNFRNKAPEIRLFAEGRAGELLGGNGKETLIYSQQGEVGVRRILGVLSLAKKYGTAAVDEACAAALEMGVHEYRFVRRYLERCPQAPLSLRQVDPLIRELVHYRDLIHTKTKEQSE